MRAVKVAKRFILRNWIWIVIGAILTVKAVQSAYTERGYFAVGGEYLVFPVFLIGVYMAKKLISDAMEMAAEERQGNRR